MTTPDESLLDKPQACEYLNIGTWHLERLIRDRVIPFIKVGRLIRFRRADLEAWLADNTVETQ